MKTTQRFWSVKKTLLRSLLCLLCLGLLAPADVLPQGAGEKYGGTVVIGMKGDFDSFNELNASDADAVQVIENMLFMGLTRLDDNLEIAPYLAERWEFSHDHRSLTFHLRRDVFWTDGEPTTAADVAFTYGLATDPKV
ncbi:MAG: hypothetical protein D6743_20425, partial [Calditrichaeota bacterium]